MILKISGKLFTLRECPRVELGYKCQSYYPGGCKSCGAGT